MPRFPTFKARRTPTGTLQQQPTNVLPPTAPTGSQFDPRRGAFETFDLGASQIGSYPSLMPMPGQQQQQQLPAMGEFPGVPGQPSNRLPTGLEQIGEQRMPGGLQPPSSPFSQTQGMFSDPQAMPGVPPIPNIPPGALSGPIRFPQPTSFQTPGLQPALPPKPRARPNMFSFRR